MEIRILRGHEVSLANQLIKNTKDCENAFDFENKKILTLMKEKHLFMLGAFEEELIGVVCIRDFKHIETLCVLLEHRRQHIASQLLEKALQLMHGEVSVHASKESYPFFIKHHFTLKDDSMNMVYYIQNTYDFKNYDEVHDFISKQKDRVYALDNFKRFMNDMCNPQNMLKSIHIGGTNGKGSTTNYIRSVLQKEGYKVATFTSPVLITRLEVMKINNQHILEEEIIQYASRYMQLWLDYGLSMFEIEVFIAVMYFLNERVDLAIFEVGLGGELDATNIISPIIAANTNIGLDHIDYLGDTYEKIARTKGGIIKDYVPFVTGEKKQVCLDVFEELCQKHYSPLIKVDEIENIEDSETEVSYDYRHYHVKLKTSAKYQSQNSALAIEILLYLRDNGYIVLDDDALLNGLYEATWAGRFEIVHENPLMIIDGAHNKEGMKAFYESARKYKNIKIIFSALRDKDTHGMMETLLKLTDDITVCEFDFYRAQTAEKLAEQFPVKIEKDWHKAIAEAYYHDGVVFITGSLYFISKVRAYILEKA